jgi:hypothetical protein
MQMLSLIEPTRHNSLPAREIFSNLFHGDFTHEQREEAADFLCEQFERATAVESDLPHKLADLEAWMHASVEAVGREYHQYLEERKAGGARRYFANKAHALHFLKAVAPTKLVDGAWLYGTLEKWQDPRFTALIRTYLEELGEGSPTKNHVVLYRKLLASQGCDRWNDLPEENYVQGAIQLALAYNAERFLPEVIGFNLGYEQLPLHLLITAYELKELHIDPYYFTLHVTVDNADSGHAKQAVDAVFNAMPRLGDAENFWRRVRNGYRLNLLGASTNSIIESFDLEREMHAIFARKAVIGQYAHSDYRRVEGRTVNDWLSQPASASDFTRAMENDGWFKRGQDPKNSRFWKLIHGEKAKMFGVFNAYEQQVIYDWIAADANRSDFDPKALPQFNALTSEAKQKLRYEAAQQNSPSDDDFDAEVRALQRDLAKAPTQSATVQKLITLMSPALHHTAPGLKATQLFTEIVG